MVNVHITAAGRAARLTAICRVPVCRLLCFHDRRVSMAGLPESPKKLATTPGINKYLMTRLTTLFVTDRQSLQTLTVKSGRKERRGEERQVGWVGAGGGEGAGRRERGMLEYLSLWTLPLEIVVFSFLFLHMFLPHIHTILDPEQPQPSCLSQRLHSGFAKVWIKQTQHKETAVQRTI